jgi:hypothetical protein
VRRDATTEELKGEVETREGIPPQMQQLLWGGKSLEKEKTLSKQRTGAGAQRIGAGANLYMSIEKTFRTSLAAINSNVTGREMSNEKRIDNNHGYAVQWNC